VTDDKSAQKLSFHYEKKGYCVNWGPYRGKYIFQYVNNTRGMLKVRWRANNIVIKDVKNEKELTVLKGHCKKIRTLMFSPNGKYLASADNRGDFYVWNWQQEKISSRIQNTILKHGNNATLLYN